MERSGGPGKRGMGHVEDDEGGAEADDITRVLGHPIRFRLPSMASNYEKSKNAYEQ